MSKERRSPTSHPVIFGYPVNAFLLRRSICCISSPCASVIVKIPTQFVRGVQMPLPKTLFAFGVVATIGTVVVCSSTSIPPMACVSGKILFPEHAQLVH